MLFFCSLIFLKGNGYVELSELSVWHWVIIGFISAKFIFDGFNTLRSVACINDGTSNRIEKLLNIKQVLRRMVADARFMQQDFEASSYDIKNALLYIDTIAQNKLRKSRLEEINESYASANDYSMRPR
jgi:hypothetical protein